jgi:hypothetical protein
MGVREPIPKASSCPHFERSVIPVAENCLRLKRPSGIKVVSLLISGIYPLPLPEFVPIINYEEFARSQLMEDWS